MSDQSQFSASKAMWSNRAGAGAPPPVVPQFSARNLAPAPAVVGSVGGSVGGGGGDAAPAAPPEVKRPPPAPQRIRVGANVPGGPGVSAAAAAGAGAAAVAARPEPVVGAPNAQASAQAAALLANGGELSFATHLTQSFEVVAKQTANGLQAVRDFYNLTKKLVAKQDEYGKGILKLIKSDGLKPAKDDGMRNIFIAWNAAQDALAKEGQQHINQAALLVQEIVVPVMEYIESMDANRKSLLAQERAASGEMAAARDAAKKAELNVVKMLESAKESLAKEKEPNKPSGVLAKIGASLAKATSRTAADLQSKAHQAAVQYQEAVSAANARQAKYLNVDLPSIFKGMQTLEFGRIDFLKALMTKYATLLRDNTTPLKQIAEHFLEGAQSMDAKADIHSFIAKWVREHGMPVPTAPFTYNLSCTPEDIKAGRFEGNPNSVFNNSLQRCMELQKSSAPGLDVPRILPALIAMVKELKGVTTEGIFRISPTKMDLDALMKQVDEQGVYDLTPQQRQPGALTPHVPAALLKQWMRSLTDPLVPENLYAQCIALAKDKDTQPQAVLQLYGQFPPLNRKVIDQLGALVREMTVPAAAKANRMGAESFAIVFSPSFFRMNAAADPIEILQNSKFETRFCLLLFKALGAYDAVAAADDQPGAPAPSAPPIVVTHVEGGAFGDDAGAAAAAAAAAPPTPSSSGLALAPAAGAAAAAGGLGSGPKPPLPRPLPKPSKPGAVASQTLRSPPPPAPPPRKSSLPSAAKAQAAAAAASAAHAAAAEPNSTAQPDFLSGDGDVR